MGVSQPFCSNLLNSDNKTLHQVKCHQSTLQHLKCETSWHTDDAKTKSQAKTLGNLDSVPGVAPLERYPTRCHVSLSHFSSVSRLWRHLWPLWVQIQDISKMTGLPFVTRTANSHPLLFVFDPPSVTSLLHNSGFLISWCTHAEVLDICLWVCKLLPTPPPAGIRKNCLTFAMTKIVGKQCMVILTDLQHSSEYYLWEQDTVED